MTSMQDRGASGTGPAPTITEQITAIERELAASRPATDLSNPDCTPGRRRLDLRVPHHLLAFLGTGRQPLCYPGWPFWYGLDRIPWQDQHHNPGPPPVIDVTRSGRVQLMFRCRYCRRPHYHGRHGACPPGTCSCELHADLHKRHGVCTCPVGTGDGHRSAHCSDDDRPSPYRRSGYYMVEVAR